MSGVNRIYWFVAGFGAAIMLAVWTTTPVRAQANFHTITTIAPAPSALPVPRRQRGAPIRRRREEGGNGTIGRPSVLRPAVDPDADPLNGSVTPAVAPQGSGLPALRDGDFSSVSGPVQPLDGAADPSLPPQPLDGSDPANTDHRSPEDRAAADGPPVGFNPSLFDIEVAPVLDRRPRQLYRFEPYQPIGHRIGSFILLGNVETDVAWFSNVFNSTQARSDVAAEARTGLRLVSNWRRHAAEVSFNGNIGAFREFDRENPKAYTLQGRGRLDVSRFTNVETLVSRAVTQESRSSIDSRAGALDRPFVTTDQVAASLNHRFNRLRIQLRGAMQDAQYGDAVVVGGTVSNLDRNLQTTAGAVRASWEFKPTLFAFAEVGLDRRAYEAAARSDGIQRDSQGERYRAGVSFGNSSQILRGEIGLGYGRQRPDDTRLPDVDGILIDGNVAWRISGLTSMIFTAASDVSETTLAGSAGAWNRTAGVEIRHAFRRHLIGNAGLSYNVQDFSGVSLVEKSLTTSAGLEYYLNRNITLFGRYRHVAFTSDIETRNYNADEVRVGMRIQH
ncbi:MAG TPA: outer membrane beta-barrel protein [Hyphomicrobiaceae bacterium]|nr:outer membrane beta-barrel protein [Hyphomicrobiaceae bacterium]